MMKYMMSISLFVDNFKDSLLIHAFLMPKHALSLSLSLRLAHMLLETFSLFVKIVLLELLHQTADSVVVLVVLAEIFIDDVARLPFWWNCLAEPRVLVCSERGYG